MEPVTGYAQLGAQRIAYQVFGDGPIDLVVTTGFWGSFDVASTDPSTGVRQQPILGPSDVKRTIGERRPTPDWRTDAAIDWQSMLT